LGRPSTFRVGIVQLLKNHAHVADTAGIAAVVQIKGNLLETFEKFDRDNDKCLSDEEIGSMFKEMGMQDNVSVQDELKKILCRNTEGKITFDVFSNWYISSESRIAVEVKRVFDRLDTNRDGRMDEEEIKVMLKNLGHHASDSDASDALAEIRKVHRAVTGQLDEDENAKTIPDKSGRQTVSFDEFYSWYHESMFWTDQKKHQQLEDEASEGYNLNWPKGDEGEAPTKRQLVMYFVTYPLAALMYVSLPDVRRPGYDKISWAVLEFTGSLIFIAFFCFCLYEWVVIWANTVGIPSVIAGLVILAPGTSVPDLLSSYVVAKQGHGDMAVSSSIGSNIFDITVGLPVPWLIYSMLNGGKSIAVQNDGLITSILVLIGMLAAVLACIVAMKWRMGKGMGIAMMILYMFFCALMVADAYVVGGVLPKI